MVSIGGQLDGNFCPGSLPHKLILFVTLIICFLVNKFLSLSLSLSLSPVIWHCRLRNRTGLRQIKSSIHLNLSASVPKQQKFYRREDSLDENWKRLSAAYATGVCWSNLTGNVTGLVRVIATVVLVSCCSWCGAENSQVMLRGSMTADRISVRGCHEAVGFGDRNYGQTWF